MINLIPNEEKKKMVKDFYLRLLVVFFLVLSFSVLIAFVSILPSYFSSSIKKSLASQKLATENNSPTPNTDKDTLSAIANLNSKLTLIENAEKNKYDVSKKVIDEVIAHKMPDIKIDEIFYQNDSTGKNIRVRGIASSRERLLLFSQALQNDPAFKSVDLPISNFVKGTDISFFLNIIPSSTQ